MSPRCGCAQSARQLVLKTVAVTSAAPTAAVHSHLAADLQHLRQVLHEEKEAQAAALSSSSSSTNPALVNAGRDELLHQLDIVAAARARERARNAELVHRLQQLHAEQVRQA